MCPLGDCVVIGHVLFKPKHLDNEGGIPESTDRILNAESVSLPATDDSLTPAAPRFLSFEEITQELPSDGRRRRQRGSHMSYKENDMEEEDDDEDVNNDDIEDKESIMPRKRRKKGKKKG